MSRIVSHGERIRANAYMLPPFYLADENNRPLLLQAEREVLTSLISDKDLKKILQNAPEG